jgi:hypothetical protein
VGELQRLADLEQRLLRDLEAAGQAEAEAVDWCAGASELYQGDPDQDPCLQLQGDAEQLLEGVLAWQQPRDFLARVARFQFSVAPNVTRLVKLATALSRAAACLGLGLGEAPRTAAHTPANCTEEQGAQEQGAQERDVLEDIAEDDRRSLWEEHRLLTAAAQRSLAVLGEWPDAPSAPRALRGLQGLQGLVRQVLRVQALCH